MKPIVVVARLDADYARTVVAHLVSGGAAPRLVLLGSKVERALFTLRSLRRIRERLGWRETVARWRRVRAERAMPGIAPAIADQASRHGFPVRFYDCINIGPMIVDILEIPDAVVVLAGCGLVDRAMLHAARGGCVNGHPALLPGLRGVDVLEWALAEDAPIGVSAHHVTAEVDGGDVILSETVEPGPGEEWVVFAARLQARQAATLAAAAIAVAAGDDRRRPNPAAASTLRYAAPARVHAAARRRFAARTAQGAVGD